MKVGVVLGAGGLPGDAFHRGTLGGVKDAWGLDARDAAVVVGTSAGSMTLAALRAAPGQPVLPDLPTLETGRSMHLADLLPDVRGLARYASRPWTVRPGTFMAALLPAGRHSTDVLSGALAGRFAGTWPQQPSWVVAVRRRDGKRVVFGRDNVLVDLPTAVAASCAIPGFFRPVRIGGDEYVDGFVYSSTNADVLAGEGLDIVVVSAPMGVHLPGARPVVDLPLRLACHAQLRREVASLRRAGTRVVVVEPGRDMLDLLGYNPLHALRIDEIEEQARDLTAQRLRQLPLKTLLSA